MNRLLHYIDMNIDDFKKVQLRVATVMSAERVEGSDKLVKLQLDAGDVNETGERQARQVIAGVGKAYDPAELAGKQVVIIANLEPRMLMGLESNGMLLAANGEAGPVFLTPEKPVPPGATIQ